MKTVTITLEQALVALECVENDIALSEFGEVEFEDVEALQFYLKRAELLQRLKAAISAAKAD
jgi:hypothetical protein